MENSYSGEHDDAKMNDIPEESSWTFYIQEFMYDQDDHSNYSSDCETPSLVSDAASSPLKKFKNLNVGLSSGKTSSRIKLMSKQNSFKKQKNNTAVIPVLDLELEDTASSPVNSPRVSYMNQFMKDKGRLDFAEVKRNIFAKGGLVALDKQTAFTDLKLKQRNSL